MKREPPPRGACALCDAPRRARLCAARVRKGRRWSRYWRHAPGGLCWRCYRRLEGSRRRARARAARDGLDVDPEELRAARTRNPWRDPHYREDVSGDERARADARIASLIAEVDRRATSASARQRAARANARAR